MPDWVPSTFVPEWKPSSFTPDSTASPKPKSLIDKAKDLTSSIDWRNLGNRFLTGPTEKDQAESQRFLSKYKRAEGATPKLLGTPESEGSIFPKLKQPESYSGGFANSLYNDFVRPLGSPSGFLGSAAPKPIPRIDPSKVAEGIKLTKEMQDAVGLNQPTPKLGLPAIGETSAPGPRRFISGPAGVAESTKTYPLDLGQHPDIFSGTVPPPQFGEVNKIGPSLAAERGLNIGEPATSKFPGHNPFDQILDFTKGKPLEIKNPKATDYNIGNGGPYELDSAIPKPLRKAQITPTAEAPWKPTTFQPLPSLEDIAKNSLYRAIPKEAKAKDAVRQWANGQEGARIRGDNLREQFKDLSDPSLVDKYESGDRSGRLAEVQKVLDDLHSQGTTAGIFKEGQKVPNYLRHEFENPEDITAALKSYVSKNPSIAKTRRFPSYAIAESEGLKRKYDNIPDLMNAYGTKVNKAVRDKELYDWLTSTGRMKAGDTISTPNQWNQFKGPDSKELERLISNVLENTSGKTRTPAINWLANLASWSKNLYLGSGIPKTPLNAHMYNISRSDMTARGIKHGLGDFMSGVFNPAKDVKTIADNRELLADLVDHGYGHSIEEHSILDEKGIKGFASKITNMQQKVFEDPLFKIHLPAVKLRFANERVSELLKRGLSKSDALTQAASEANDFYGGVNKILRNKTYNDLARIGLLAPDWLESRVNLAGKGVAALFGKADPLYAKALGRQVGMRVAGAGATAGITGKLLNPSKRATNSADIPLGKTSSGLNRDLPIFGSSAEGIRIPEEVLSGRDLGDVITSRFSQPLRKSYNILNNEDSFHNPLRGEDKYGRPIGKVKGALNTAGEAAATITPPWVIMLKNLLEGKDPEASIMTGIESPLKYNSEPKDKNAFRLR